MVGSIYFLQGESTDGCEEQRMVFEVDLEKDQNGLGLTVAGYICEKGNSLTF